MSPPPSESFSAGAAAHRPINNRHRDSGEYIVVECKFVSEMLLLGLNLKLFMIVVPERDICDSRKTARSIGHGAALNTHVNTRIITNSSDNKCRHSTNQLVLISTHICGVIFSPTHPTIPPIPHSVSAHEITKQGVQGGKRVQNPFPVSSHTTTLSRSPTPSPICFLLSSTSLTIINQQLLCA